MNRQLIEQLSPELTLYHYNDIPVLELSHAVGTAKIALQGAQLLSWQPAHSAHDLLWLSEVEPFARGNAIRGGVPICYPWFGKAKEPAHGTARISLWQLRDSAFSDEQARLVFEKFSEQGNLEATLEMIFGADCQLRFTHHGDEPAQLALHSYFNVGDIAQIAVAGLPTQCFNSLTQQHENVPSPRQIGENVDCIYTADNTEQRILDPVLQREIVIEHQNASDIVLWNPWHLTMSGMSETGYKTMVCVETARIGTLLQKGESAGVRIGLKAR